ncbi:50S ribosome-binding GTPase [Candidatus Gracilibacteria bacterium]|nr:50S ribosome-binding GTPase [Candidatus Gracilibacteria bacterium]
MEYSIEIKYEALAKKHDKLIEDVFSLLKKFEKYETIDNLKSKLDDIKQRTALKVAFVGQYNAGKSTIISAITGNKDIQIDSNVATDHSSDYFWNNIKITDTPGILAGKVEQHDITTQQSIIDSDLIVYVLTSQLFDDVIFENFIDLAYNQKLKDKMLITINKMSMEKGSFETLKNNYIQSIRTIFSERGYDFNFEVVFIDAFDFIEGVEEGEDELIQLSNFENFIVSLNSFIERKGIIQKAFDTPIRAIKEELNQIALNETDPSFNLLINKYENRLKKHKNELIREVGYIYNNLKDKLLSEGYSVTTSLDQTTEEEFNLLQNKFNMLIENESIETMKQIEDLIIEKNRVLGEELEEINKHQDVIIYTNNLNKNFDRKKIEYNFRSNSSLETKLNLIDTLKSQASRLTSFTGADKATSIFAKSSEIAGSSGHSIVYNVGKTIGYKFKPWQAVNITKNIGNVAKIAGPALSILSVGLSVYDAVKEEKKLKQIVSSKNQLNSNFYDIANDLINEIDKKFKEYLYDNVDKKLNDFQNKKMEILKINDTNSKLLSEVNKLNTEFSSFIEEINN